MIDHESNQIPDHPNTLSILNLQHRVTYHVSTKQYVCYDLFFLIKYASSFFKVINPTLILCRSFLLSLHLLYLPPSKPTFAPIFDRSIDLPPQHFTFTPPLHIFSPYSHHFLPHAHHSSHHPINSQLSPTFFTLCFIMRTNNEHRHPHSNPP
jgi:hypothetical protein